MNIKRIQKSFEKLFNTKCKESINLRFDYSDGYKMGFAIVTLNKFSKVCYGLVYMRIHNGIIEKSFPLSLSFDYNEVENKMNEIQSKNYGMEY